MNTDFILLKAQFNALRNLYMARLSNRGKDIAWLDKYILWKYEREILLSEDNTPLPSPESERLERRRFQLQVLMDVAYIQGHLEQFDLIRYISPDAYNIASEVGQHSDCSEESMLPLIDKYC